MAGRNNDKETSCCEGMMYCMMMSCMTWHFFYCPPTRSISFACLLSCLKLNKCELPHHSSKNWDRHSYACMLCVVCVPFSGVKFC